MQHTPFRVFRKELCRESFAACIAPLGFHIARHDCSDSAYDDEVLELRQTAGEGKEVRIVVKRAWDPDGEDFADVALILTYEGSIKLEIDIEALLRRQLKQPLRVLIMDHLRQALESTPR